MNRLITPTSGSTAPLTVFHALPIQYYSTLVCSTFQTDVYIGLLKIASTSDPHQQQYSRTKAVGILQ